MTTASLATLAAGFLICAASPVEAAFALTDVTFWTGAADGPGVSRAAVVIDWNDGGPPLAWGYRWESAQRKTAADMLTAILAADQRLSLQGLAGGFISHLAFDADLNGTPERFRPGFNGATGEYWLYAVNNEVYFHPTDFGLNSHIVPPSTVVVPNGNPFANLQPGHWITSSTGVGGRELADGSWDGFVYRTFAELGAGPAEPVAPIPEPAVAFLLAIAAPVFLSRRRKTVVLFLAGTSFATAGPYPPAAGQAGSDALPANSPAFIGWATGVAQIQRGLQQIGNPSLGVATYGDTDDNGAPVSPAYWTAGPASTEADNVYDVLSLGDGGSVTLTFSQPIGNGAGPDFAVFENGFSYTGGTYFLELAFVEVSSNGMDFFRFPSVSLTQTAAQIGAFTGIDPTNLRNLAGKYQNNWGTPFDLEELKDVSAKLNVNRITHVRIIDVIGSLNAAYGSRDSQGHLINDPWPTPYDSSGFDLDAVGVLHTAQPPWLLWQQEKFSAAQLADANISGPNADPDKDGRRNLLEYAVGSNPLASESAPPLEISWNNGAVLQFFRQPSHTDLSYTLQQSTGGAWTNVARSSAGGATAALISGSGLSVSETGASTVRVTVRLPGAARSQFRLLIQQS